MAAGKAVQPASSESRVADFVSRFLSRLVTGRLLVEPAAGPRDRDWRHRPGTLPESAASALDVRRSAKRTDMRDFWTSISTFALLCISAGCGRFVHARLPETYRTRETVETMQLVIGMLVTFAALVLGLLTASVKTTYDAAARDRHAYALQLTELDRCLRDYGSDAELARQELARYTAGVIASTWPQEQPPAGIRYPDTTRMPIVGASPVLGELMDAVGQQIRGLDPHTPVALKTADDCRASFRDVLRARFTVIEDAGASFAAPFFWVLVFWLTVAFLALGLAAPRNRVATLGILLCAVSLSSVIFVITDLSRPYRGLMAISSTEMRTALAQMLAPSK